MKRTRTRQKKGDITKKTREYIERTTQGLKGIFCYTPIFALATCLTMITIQHKLHYSLAAFGMFVSLLALFKMWESLWNLAGEQI